MSFFERARARLQTVDYEPFGVSNTLVPYTFPKAYPDGNYLPMLIIGEAPGVEEEKHGALFVGASGQLLDQWLSASGLERDRIPILNVFRYRPDNNDVRKFFAPLNSEPVCADLSPKGTVYLKAPFRAELLHLKQTILDFHPEVVVTLGSTASWAVLNHDMSIQKLTAERADHMRTLEHGGRFARFTLFPAYHPSAALRGGDGYEAISLRALKKARAFLKPAMY